jgi:PucR C-terminal helix-turn-helix domain/GGDEF-like domain
VGARVSGATADRAITETTEERALDDVLARLEARTDDLVEVATTAIFDQIPAYQAHANPQIVRDVRQHVREHILGTLRTFRDPREITPEDLLFIRRYAAHRAGQFSVADFIHAFQVGQRILWNAAVSLAGDDASRRAVLSLVDHITRYFEVAVTHAAEVYLEVEQLLGATGERLRRDTLEDLIAGADVAPGPGEQAIREAGLERDGRCLVISAEPVGQVADVHALRSAAGALARVPRRSVQPLTVIRHEEIVIIAPVRASETAGVVERLTATQRRLAERKVPLAVGMSTVHTGLAAVPAAYREALEARAVLAGRPGTVALPALRVLDYLVQRSSPTARRLVPEAIEQFVAEDTAQGGALVATLRAYAEADLNVKRSAERLHIHVNTAHYRLAKIEERTGLDLRHVSDVVELLIAAQLAAEIRDPPLPT